MNKCILLLGGSFPKTFRLVAILLTLRSTRLKFYTSAVKYLPVEITFSFLYSSARGWFLVLPDWKSGQAFPLSLNHYLLKRSLLLEMSARLNFVSFCFIYANCDHWLDNSSNVSTEICRKRLLHCLYFVCHSELRYLNQNVTFFLGI